MERPGDPAATDVVLGLLGGAADLAWWATGPLRSAGWAVAVRVGELPGPSGGSLAAELGERGAQARAALDAVLVATVRAVLRRVVEIALATLDLTELVRQNVDLDAVAADLDLDAAVARVDLDAVVARVDLDAAVGRVDLDAVVARVDLDAVARRLDLDALASRIDPDPVIGRVDVAAALSHFDVVAIARGVVDAIDLPEIVRASTGTLASDTVRGIRAEAREADDGVERFVRRWTGRRRAGGVAPA